MQKSKPISTPMNTSGNLDKEEGLKPIVKNKY